MNLLDSVSEDLIIFLPTEPVNISIYMQEDEDVFIQLRRSLDIWGITNSTVFRGLQFVYKKVLGGQRGRGRAGIGKRSWKSTGEEEGMN